MNRVYSARAAEKILFREEFRDAATVHRNGGTLVGAPAIKSGIFLDGATQYATYTVGATDLARTQISIVLEFTPDFAADDGLTRYLVSSPANDYLVVKHNAANGNQIFVYLGGVFGISVPLASYLPYWKIGEKNTLVISGESGDNNVWLNGTQVLAGNATAWSVKYPTTLFIGVSNTGTNHFPGIFYSLSFREGLLTQADVDAIQEGRFFRYVNDVAMYLDLSTAIIDGANDRTLDKSRNGLTVLLGDGAGAGTPTWEAPGFTFDAVDDLLTLPPDPTGTFTVAWKRRNEATVIEHDLTTWAKLKVAGSFEGLLDYLAVWEDYELSPLQVRDLDIMWSGGRP